MPHANSMFSMPRATSPRASLSTLPCSAVSREAISLRFAATSSRTWNRISARRDRLVERHSTDAALADATAASTSSALAKSTSAACSPVAGLNTTPERPDVPATTLPSIQWEMRVLIVDPPRVVVRAPQSPGTGFWGAKSCRSARFCLWKSGFFSGTGSVEIAGEVAREVLAVALGADVAVVLDDHRASAQHGVDLAVDLEALPCRVVHVHVVLLVDADRGVPGRVPHEDVGVETGRDLAFRLEAEQSGRGGGARLDPTLERDLAVHHALVQQLHAMLDAADAVGDLGEVADADLLLLLEAERAVVGGHHRQLVQAQTLPQVAGVRLVLGAQRRRAHPLRPLEPGLGELVLDRQVEVLRARLPEDVLACVLGRGNLLERLGRRHVHDVQRHVA